MPDRLVKMDGTLIANLDGATKCDSREGLCVYLKDFTAYKLFTSLGQAQAASQAAADAKNAGVPVARETKPYYAAQLIEGVDTTNVYVLEAERHIGHFFQLAKPGQPASFVSTVKAADTVQPGIKEKVIRALQLAQNHRITDPQGFFDPTLGMPLRFFDVHTGASAAPQIQTVLDGLQ